MRTASCATTPTYDKEIQIGRVESVLEGDLGSCSHWDERRRRQVPGLHRLRSQTLAGFLLIDHANYPR